MHVPIYVYNHHRSHAFVLIFINFAESSRQFSLQWLIFKNNPLHNNFWSYIRFVFPNIYSFGVDENFLTQKLRLHSPARMSNIPINMLYYYECDLRFK